MSTRKTTTPRQGSAPEKTIEERATEVAALISAVLNHPDTPTVIYDHIHEAMCEIYIPVSFTNSVAYIAPHILQEINDTPRKRGARR